MRDRRAVAITFAILATIILIPSGVHPAKGQLVGLVCLSPSSSSACPAPPATVSAPVGSQMSVSVIVQGSDILDGFDITLKANHTIIKAADANLAGSIVSGGTVFVKCIGGVLKTGSACGTTDTVDTIHFGVVGPLGFFTIAPTSGLLFTAIFNVTGTTTSPISFQTGCSRSSVNGTTTCVFITNGTTFPSLETVQGASYTATPAPTFAIGTLISPAEITISRRETGNSTVALFSLNGFAGTVALSEALTPTARHPPTITLSSSSVTLTSGGFNTVLLTASAASNTDRIQYTITVTGTSGSQIGSVQITLFVING